MGIFFCEGSGLKVLGETLGLGLRLQVKVFLQGR